MGLMPLIDRARARALACALALALLPVWSSAPAHAGIPAVAVEGDVPSLAPLLDKITPAVVNISVTSAAPVQQNPLLQDPFFRRFFNLPDTPPRAQPRMSAGSGVIVDARRGYVLTNNHVVENATEIAVTLKDRRQFKATLVGRDPETDVAMLRIDARDLTALAMGNSDKLRVGDYVLAIGNPFGLGQTVTSGIVSALGRSGLNIEGYEDFIQTDASINPGNSGGALVNLKGELIGINTAIVAPAGGNVGIGFAVPANMAHAVMEQLASFGEIRRGRLGVAIQDVTPDLAEALRLDRPVGAVITNVEAGSSAEKAGLRQGDVIVAVDNDPIEGASDLRNKIGLEPVGGTIALDVIRDGRKRTIRAEVVKMRAESASAGAISPMLEGAVLTDIDRNSPQYGRVDGVAVTSVKKGSPAWQHGLRDGDILVAVNRGKIRSLAEATEALADAGPIVALNILRGNSMLYLVIR
ncbi:MAG: DegQ family serine endoprotease [Rhodospirillales bacterium]|nr:DegQ family serine endoprotease [Rhodospirillales bacterium]